MPPGEHGAEGFASRRQPVHRFPQLAPREAACAPLPLGWARSLLSHQCVVFSGRYREQAQRRRCACRRFSGCALRSSKWQGGKEGGRTERLEKRSWNIVFEALADAPGTADAGVTLPKVRPSAQALGPLPLTGPERGSNLAEAAPLFQGRSQAGAEL